MTFTSVHRKSARLGIVSLAAVLSLAACSGSASGGSASGGSGDVPVVRIGMPIPLSGSGAAVGKRFQIAAGLAIDELNKEAAGKIRFESVIQDSQCAPQPATTVAKNLILKENVNALVGELCSSATLAVKAVAEAEKVPLVVPDSSAMAITGPDSKWTFRIIPNEKYQHQALANVAIKYFHFKKFAVAYEQTDSGIGARNVFEATAKELGASIVLDTAVDREASDFTAVVGRIKDAKPDALHLTMLLTPGVRFEKALKEQGVDIPVFSSIWFAYPLFEKLAGTAAENNVRQLFYIDTSTYPPAKAFTDLYHSKLPNATDIPDFNHAQYYAAVKLVGKAAMDCGPSATEIRDCLAKTKDFQSPIGPITFDNEGQAIPTSQSIVTIQDKNGKVEVLDERKDFDAKAIYGW